MLLQSDWRHLGIKNCESPSRGMSEKKVRRGVKATLVIVTLAALVINLSALSPSGVPNNFKIENVGGKNFSVSKSPIEIL